MVGTSFINTLCKRVLPLNLSNKKIDKLELAGFDSQPSINKQICDFWTQLIKLIIYQLRESKYGTHFNK